MDRWYYNNLHAVSFASGLEKQHPASSSPAGAATLAVLAVLSILAVLPILPVISPLVPPIIAAIILSLTNSKLGTIILRPTLRNRHNDRLMVASTAHRADPVESRWKAISHDGLELSVSVSGVVNTLKEGECFGVRSGGIKMSGR